MQNGAFRRTAHQPGYSRADPIGISPTPAERHKEHAVKFQAEHTIEQAIEIAATKHTRPAYAGFVRGLE
jgi:hypothetical protein